VRARRGGSAPPTTIASVMASEKNAPAGGGGDDSAHIAPLVDDEDDEKKVKCRLIMRFLKETGLYTKLVASLVSSPVHMDLVMDKAGTKHRRVCFSAYMHEKFSMTLMPSAMVHDDAYENHAVEIAEADFDRLSKFLGSMVGRYVYANSTAFHDHHSTSFL
jgi:hypothetical protein